MERNGRIDLPIAASSCLAVEVDAFLRKFAATFFKKVRVHRRIVPRHLHGAC